MKGIRKPGWRRSRGAASVGRVVAAFVLSAALVPVASGTPSGEERHREPGPGHGASGDPALPALRGGDGEFTPRDPARVALGRLLFFDKVLSGNLNISCATCHHPLLGTGDGLSLPAGEGARGLGVTRDTGSEGDEIPARVPRNAPPLFNLGARQFTRLFHDGRVEEDPGAPGGFRTPAGHQLPDGLESALAAQAMFPVTSGTEMAGQPGENPIADAAGAGLLAGPGGVWDRLARRLRAIPEYVALFREAFPEVVEAGDITFVQAANAIAEFEAEFWRADASPFDQFLRGARGAMSPRQKRGMRLFYGRAGCAGCHSGLFQTDHRFHAIAMPQAGPGKGQGATGYEDFGREGVTGDPGDRYRFRTPSLRNVVLTGPWGHDGAYATLEAVVRHHLNPVRSLREYDPGQLVLPSREDLDAIDLVVMEDPGAVAAIGAANELAPVRLRRGKLRDLLAFLGALTDPASLDLRSDVPRRVPSGLPIFD